MAYNNGCGGTVHLPSPTNIHHIDAFGVSSAVRSLRRSLSRSPSKFRLAIDKSPSPSPKSPLSPSPLSPPKRQPSQLFSSLHSHTPSPLAVPFPPSAKLTHRSSRKPAPIRTSSSTRTSPRSPIKKSPRSPIKRALSDSSDSGNAIPRSSQLYAFGQENKKSGSLSPAERRSFEKVQFNVGSTTPAHHALMRFGGDGASDYPSSNTSTPLKRTDAFMNLEQANLGSPIAKRRSLHGAASFGHEFNALDHGPASQKHFEIHDEGNQEYELSASSVGAGNSPFNMPRRSSSLRRSTLQQRTGEKTSWGRKHAQELATIAAAQEPQEFASPAPSRHSKDRPRLSLDQFMPPAARGSPFNIEGSLPNASVHIVQQKPGNGHPAHQPHPLSKTLTQSSSSSSFTEDSPIHVPINFGNQAPRGKVDFSASLPNGALRPSALQNFARKESMRNAAESFSTPPSYKLVKPHQGAFMSTGLISKVNRYPEEQPATRGTGKANMPDTPCKKPVAGFHTIPAPAGSVIHKSRHIRHSFGTPSTPFNPHGIPPSQGTFGKLSSIFGSGFGKGNSRRGSFLSVDGEESAEYPENHDGQASMDSELPPTPTKAVLISTNGGTPGTPYNVRSMPASMSAFGLTSKAPRLSSKLNPLSSPREREEDDDSDESFIDPLDSPTTANFRLSSKTSPSQSSFSRSRALRGSHKPMPKSLTIASLSPSLKPGFAKISRVAPASPLERIDFMERMSPRTPHESSLPDPSGLSISVRKEKKTQPTPVKSAMFPPATPTAGREQFGRKSTTPLNGSTTPINGFASSNEIDHSLCSRFDKVELIGTGEFSQVYRATQSNQSRNTGQSFYFGGSASPSPGVSPPSPIPDRVFAVKKARQAFTGVRDRQRRLKEVEVLKVLGKSLHTIEFKDSWEEQNHLYIQTEFCDEGGLDIFLSRIGRKGRLDDFRIWKIMLELSLGLKHIHDSGFMHLDLKPANIFITFEGVLKIGDFGMATTYPAAPGTECEGDREYIGPEILMGLYDKHSDIFSFGLIMLEIAGNVELPDNGPTWQKLRSGDMSDVPSLTSDGTSSIARSTMTRDSAGDTPMGGNDNSFRGPSPRKYLPVNLQNLRAHNASNLFGQLPVTEFIGIAPKFMRDCTHPSALDSVVRWMIQPDPDDRPTADELLQTEGARYAFEHRRAGATVFEGLWGPSSLPPVDCDPVDCEMVDV